MIERDVLADSTALLEVLFERTHLAVAVLDRKLVLRRLNGTFADYLRRNGAKNSGPVEVGQSLHRYFPATRQQTEQLCAPTLAGETRWHRDAPFEVDGQMTYWDILLTPLHAGDDVAGMVFIFFDATERTEAQQLLRRSERRFRSMLRNSSDLVALVDTEGTMLYAAPSVWQLLDVTPATGPRACAALPIHPSDLDTMRESLARCAASSGNGPTYRCRFRRGDNVWRTFEVSLVNLLEDPDVGGIVLTGRDITERESAEEELARRDSVLEAVRIAAQRFLESQSSWRASINEVMQLLGKAAGVSRVYIFENFRAANGTASTRQTHEWVADGIAPRIGDPELGSHSMDFAPFAPVAKRLAVGEVVIENVADLAVSQRAVLEPRGIVSVVLMPVFVAGQWWGMLGYDDCVRERTWSVAEIDALRAASSTLGAAVARQRAEDELREQQAERTQAFELLEQRVTALSAVAAGLTVNQRLSRTMDIVAESVVAGTPAIACAIYVLDVDTSRLRLSAHVGLPDGYAELADRCVQAEPDLLNRLNTVPEPVIGYGVAKIMLADPALAPLHDLIREIEWDTTAVVPLRLQQRRLGWVTACYLEGVDPSSDDLAFLRAVADQGAVAVENARLLAEAQNKAGMDERQRLARELHDSVSQALYGIALGAKTAKVLAGQGADVLTEPLDYILSLAEAGMTEMRSLIFELRPESLANEGLIVALAKRVAVLRTRHRLRVRTDLCAEPCVPLAVKETVYRVAQEAFHNAVKHARAELVEVSLAMADDGQNIELRITDNGVGFEPGQSRPGHLGLQSMQERAATHGGTFELSTRIGGGTTIHVRLPVIVD